jgi:hypothetical protein
MAALLLLLLLLANAVACFGRPASTAKPADWLLASDPSTAFAAALHTDSKSGRLTLVNTLISREFTTAPDFACVSFRSLMASPPSEILRAVQPEALVQLDGTTYHIGGLVLPEEADLSNCSATHCPDAARRGVYTDSRTLATMVRNQSAFNYVSHSSGRPRPRFEWTPGTRHAPSTGVAWPAKGVTLDVVFAAPASAAVAHRQLEVVVHYELFAGAPVVTKSLSIRPRAGVPPNAVSAIVVTGATVEYLSVTQPYSPLALYSYAPPSRQEAYAQGKHGQGEAFNGAHTERCCCLVPDHPACWRANCVVRPPTSSYTAGPRRCMISAARWQVCCGWSRTPLTVRQ